ncbi:hypothetical protein BK120_30225 [Paenibacillus sp. FSL A5-0031]|nr:hypothetical protein BK120_30225 [Paenibacillus sp. FSL A5-0031]
MLITVKLSIDPLLVPWIGKVNYQSITGNRFLVILTFTVSILLILFPLSMNIVAWLGVTILLLLLSTGLMTLNDAKIFRYSTGHNRHKIVSGYSMVTDFGAATGPLLGFSSISLFGDLATAWGASLLLNVCVMSEIM